MKFSRRMVLRGAGGVALGLPLLESFGSRRATAAEPVVPPFAIFFRQANGVAAAQNTDEIGAEPERFWPRQHGVLDAANVEGRAIDELTEHLARLLVISNVNNSWYPYGDGHANGALQGLTARPPVVPEVAGDSEASGESLDHRIGADLNPDGRDSLFLYAGRTGGWLGGPCISYRGPDQRRAALHNPIDAYRSFMGLDSGDFELLALRQASVNDMVKEQMQTLMARPELSTADRQRLDLHFAAIRDLENNLSCTFADDRLRELEGLAAGYDSDDGDLVLAAARAHMDVAVLAVACGHTRSVAIQVGDGNDGQTRYRDHDTGDLMENYHFVSHRRLSHDSSGAVIPGSDVLHHKIDRQFAQAFKHLLDRLASYPMPDGSALIDGGIAAWYNDNANGPGHSAENVPWVIGGSANGFLVQGQYVEASGGQREENHGRLLATLGSAVGLRKPGTDEYLDGFGDPALPTGMLDELMA